MTFVTALAISLTFFGSKYSRRRCRLRGRQGYVAANKRQPLFMASRPGMPKPGWSARHLWSRCFGVEPP